MIFKKNGKTILFKEIFLTATHNSALVLIITGSS